MDHVQDALQRFGPRMHCAQAVFSTFAESQGMERSLAYRTAVGFGAGISRLQRQCGAVSGGIMALGLMYSWPKHPQSSDRDRLYEGVRQFVSAFEERMGTSICTELIPGCDLLTPE